MPRFLMDRCLNNRKDICNEKVKYSRWPRRLGSTNDIPVFPLGKAQDELDDICQECPHAMFVFQECCPVCSELKISLVEHEKIVLKDSLSVNKFYLYICSRCGRYLYSKNPPPC